MWEILPEPCTRVDVYWVCLVGLNPCNNELCYNSNLLPLYNFWIDGCIALLADFLIHCDLSIGPMLLLGSTHTPPMVLFSKVTSTSDTDNPKCLPGLHPPWYLSCLFGFLHHSPGSSIMNMVFDLWHWTLTFSTCLPCTVAINVNAYAKSRCWGWGELPT